MAQLTKQKRYWDLYTKQSNSVSEYYKILEETNDLQYNYQAYMTTHPINCKKELERLPQADYITCCALLTMLLREDHFCEGSFEKRVETGEVQLVIEKMLNFLIGDIDINKFIDLLSSYNTQNQNVYNQYKDSVLRKNLYNYLTYLQQTGVDIFLVGEAPGYLGCRVTGIPFTDEVQLKNPENQFALGYWARNETCGDISEKTATYVWDALRKRKEVIPLLWNAFPFHPYSEGDENSNRPPTKNEMRIGEFLLRYLKEIFDIPNENIYSIGRKAQTQLKLSEEKYIRHPSYGGSFEFKKKIISILK